MAEETSRTCVACGHPQAGGDFCEKCGTRLPPVAPPPPPQPVQSSPAPAHGAYPPPPGPGTPPPPGGYYGPPPGYEAPRPDSGWAVFGDFKFRRLLSPALVKLVWIVTMVFTLLYVIYNIIVIGHTWGPGDVSIFSLFRVLAFALFFLLIVRLFLEIAVAVGGMREKK